MKTCFLKRHVNLSLYLIQLYILKDYDYEKAKNILSKGGWPNHIFSSLRFQAKQFIYRPFHKTLRRSSAFVNWISVRFYETGCIFFFSLLFTSETFLNFASNEMDAYTSTLALSFYHYLSLYPSTMYPYFHLSA